MKGWGAPYPRPFASREGLGPPTLVHLQVVQGWGGSREGLGPNPCPFANRGWGAPNPCLFGSRPNPGPFGSRPQVVKGCGAPNQPLSIWRPPPSHEGLGGPQPRPKPLSIWGGGAKQVVKGWGPNPCPFASREGLGGGV